MIFSHVVRERIRTQNLQFKQARWRKEDLNPRFTAGDLMSWDYSIPPGQGKPMGAGQHSKQQQPPLQSSEHTSPTPAVHAVPDPKHSEPSFQLTEEAWNMVVWSTVTAPWLRGRSFCAFIKPGDSAGGRYSKVPVIFAHITVILEWGFPPKVSKEVVVNTHNRTRAVCHVSSVPESHRDTRVKWCTFSTAAHCSKGGKFGPEGRDTVMAEFKSKHWECTAYPDQLDSTLKRLEEAVIKHRRKRL